MTRIAANLDVMTADGRVLRRAGQARGNPTRMAPIRALARAGTRRCWRSSPSVPALVVADWTWVLPTAVPGLSACWPWPCLAVYLIIRFRRPLDRAGAAAKVEAHFPDLGQRLRTVVEYAEPAPDTVPASRGLLRALDRDTDRRVAGLDFRVHDSLGSVRAPGCASCSSRRRARARHIARQPRAPNGRVRMLLLPVHYTTLKVEPGDLTLKAGHELKLDATLSGRPVASASWSYRMKDGGGRWITASLVTTPGPGEPRQPLIGTLSASLKDCQTDFDYRVVAGEVESPTFHVKVVHPLVLKGLEATITPPAYTRRPNGSRQGGELSCHRGIESAARRHA